ncbi:MAG: hypothetical protein AAGD25_08015 [Cyanobacteria bacterium P01_F01_bin.150]
MESWTFLIQQQEDDVWLPLESSGSEILEDRYRIMARTTQANCALAVQISHLDLDALPPRRRVHNRQARTNEKGLVALLPFTLLKPGVWEIRCHYEAELDTPAFSENKGKKDLQKQTLQIQVLAQEAGADLDGAEFYPNEASDLLTSRHSMVMANSANTIATSASVKQQDAAEETTGDADMSADIDSLLRALNADNDTEQSAEDLLIQNLDAVDSGDDEKFVDNTENVSDLPGESCHEADVDTLPAVMDDIEESLMQNDAQNTLKTDTADNILQDLMAELKQEPLDEMPGNKDSSYSLRSSETGNEVAQNLDKDALSETREGEPEAEEMQVLMDAADQMAAHIIETMNAKLYQMQNQSSPSEPSALMTDASEATYPAPSPSTHKQRWDEETLKRLGLNINLARDCYTVLDDQLILTGMIEGQDSHSALNDLTLALHVQLVQPQSGNCLLEHDVAVPVSSLPTPFSVLMAIPKNLSTHILVGEVLLMMVPAATAPDHSLANTDIPETVTADETLDCILAQQSFTVTVELGALLNTIQQQKQAMSVDASSGTVLEDESFSESLLPSQTPDATESELPTSEAIATRELQPAGYSPLPPKLNPHSPKNRRSPKSGKVKARNGGGPSAKPPVLDLPSFLQNDGDRPPSPMAMAIAHAMQASGSLNPPAQGQAPASEPFTEEDAIPDVEAANNEYMENELPENRLPESESFEIRPSGADSPELEFLEAELLAVELSEPEPSVTKSSRIETPARVQDGQEDAGDVDIAFKPGSLPDHSSLDVEQMSFGENPFGQLPEETPPVNKVAPAPLQALSLPSTSPVPINDERPTVCPPLPEYTPIPTPTLIMSQEELVPGMPVRISVTLPQSVLANGVENQSIGYGSGNPPVSLIFVKLWVQDRQTRSILDGPRWLVDFIPNTSGELEAMTQLVLPIGCLEVSVEAIAVEIATQRESDKTTLHRSIMPTMPPSLTTFDFDDLN